MKSGPKLKRLSVFKDQFYVYPIFEVFIVEWDYILYHGLILSILHDICSPHSCMTVQKVPYLAPLCPQILAGALTHLFKYIENFTTKN